MKSLLCIMSHTKSRPIRSILILPSFFNNVIQLRLSIILLCISTLSVTFSLIALIITPTKNNLYIICVSISTFGLVLSLAYYVYRNRKSLNDTKLDIEYGRGIYSHGHHHKSHCTDKHRRGNNYSPHHGLRELHLPNTYHALTKQDSRRKDNSSGCDLLRRDALCEFQRPGPAVATVQSFTQARPKARRYTSVQTLQIVSYPRPTTNHIQNHPALL